jgi:hypothetical protein
MATPRQKPGVAATGVWKTADSLWTRLILDVNRATDVVRYTIG